MRETVYASTKEMTAAIACGKLDGAASVSRAQSEVETVVSVRWTELVVAQGIPVLLPVPCKDNHGGYKLNGVF